MRVKKIPTERGIRRVGIYSVIVNLFLVGAKMTLAEISGSLTLRADAIHSVVDILASLAVLAGLIISGRKTKTFPYGLYKLENLVALAISLLLFLTGYEIVREAIFTEPKDIFLTPWVLGVVGLLSLVPLFYGLYEARVGRKSNSPSLIAEARAFQTDVLSSMIVFLVLVGQSLGLPLDRVGAGIVVIFILKAGWSLFMDSVRVLLDASLDKKLLEEIRLVLDSEPAVAWVKSVTGRNSGRYRFVEVEVTLRIGDLEKAHIVSKNIENRIKATVPKVDSVLVHYEPVARTEVRYSVPLQENREAVSEHFGEAPFFALILIKSDGKQLLGQEVFRNPHATIDKGKGIKAAELLLAHKTDVVLARESLVGKGPGYVFSNAGVESRQTEANTLKEVVWSLTHTS